MNKVSPLSHQLLTKNLMFSPEYQGRLTNHLSMAIIALERAGAKPQRLSSFFSMYADRLDLIDAISVEERSAYSGKVTELEADITQHGWESVLVRELKHLQHGLSSAAFHALIRTSFAVKSGHQSELASALAYWHDALQPIPVSNTTAPYSADQQLDKAHQLFTGYTFSPGIIVDRVNEVMKSDEYSYICSAPEYLSLDDIARLTLHHYLRTNDFTYLHGVTGFQALVHLLPYFEDKQTVLTAFWQAYVATFCTQVQESNPNLKNKESVKESWDELQSQANESDDDHTIKLAYSCRWLDERFPQTEYKQAVKMRLMEEQG